MKPTEIDIASRKGLLELKIYITYKYGAEKAQYLKCCNLKYSTFVACKTYFCWDK